MIYYRAIEYSKVLDSLHPDKLPNPLYCASAGPKYESFYCGAKHTCYTDYEPHFNPGLSLNGTTIPNGHGWKVKYSTKTLPWGAGYMDRAVHLSCSSAAVCGELSLRVNITAEPHIFLVGGGLKGLTFYIDVHNAGLSTYVRPLSLQPWRDVSPYALSIGSYVDINSIPVGQHVLTLSVSKNSTTAVTLSHLISW